MKFIAEIVEIKQRTVASMDHEFTIKLRTNDKMIMSLSGIPPQTNVLVEVKDEHDRG